MIKEGCGREKSRASLCLDSRVDGVSSPRIGLSRGQAPGEKKLMCGWVGEDISLGSVEFEVPVGHASEISSQQIVV